MLACFSVRCVIVTPGSDALIPAAFLRFGRETERFAFQDMRPKKLRLEVMQTPKKREQSRPIAGGALRMGLLDFVCIWSVSEKIVFLFAHPIAGAKLKAVR